MTAAALCLVGIVACGTQSASSGAPLPVATPTATASVATGAVDAAVAKPAEAPPETDADAAKSPTTTTAEPLDAAPPDRRPNASTDPDPELRKLVEVLDYLAKLTTDEDAKHENWYRAGYDPRRVNRLDVERVMAVISPDGVQFSDVNMEVQAGRLSPAQIKKSLRAKRGEPFKVFAHLGYLRSGMFHSRNRSVVLEGRDDENLYVRFAGRYRLVLRRAEGGAVLVRCAYDQREGH